MLLIDRIIGVVSPEMQARRMRARIAVDRLGGVKRGYEGAARGRRTKGWHTTGSSANADTLSGLSTLRARSRDLVRNNPWAERGVRVITSNTVGTGIIPQARARGQRRVTKIQDLWQEWGETTACDAAGKNNFYGLQSLVMRTVAQSGECLIRRITRPGAGLPVPLQLQVMEPDHLDVMRDGPISGGGRIIQGVEFDASGKVVAYWLFTTHPGEIFGTLTTVLSKRVDASEILHVYRADRPGQVRGVPWLAAAMIRLRDLDEYEDAQLLRQKIAACFAGFIRDIEGVDGATAATTPEEFDPMQPGTLQVLGPGRDIVFGTPPSTTGYSEYVATILRSFAATLGITYEALTNDYSSVNFSSGRMGWVEMSRNIEQWRWEMLIPAFCDPAYEWFIAAAELVGKAKGKVARSWTPPRREMLDPVKEMEATKQAIRNGLVSLPEALRQNGYDPEEVMTEIAESNKALDDLGIILDCDPRLRSNTGSDPAAGGSTAATPAADQNKKVDETANAGG